MQLSEKVIEILAARNEKSRRIGELKQKMGLPLVDVNAERELRERVREVAERYGLDREFVQRLLTFVLAESVKQQYSDTKAATPKITHMDVFRKAKQLERSGRKIIHLEVGEPDFGAPAPVHEALSRAAISGYARYGEAKGLQELRTRIAEFLRERFGVDRHPEEVLVVPGGRFGVFVCAAALLSPGEEVVVIDPSWPLYKQVAHQLHSRPMIVRTKMEDGWIPRVEDVEGCISSVTRLLVLNYPNNPTGAVIDGKRLEEIVEVCRRRSIYVLSDEVYMDYCFGEFNSILELGYENALMLMSFSKSWGMTGYRIGFLVGSREVIERASSIQAMLMTCVPEFVQMAALKALDDLETPKRYGQIMRERVEEVCRMLDSMPVRYVKPKGGMYVFPKIEGLSIDSAELALRLLESKGVAIAPGSAFGDYVDYVRISTGTSIDEIREGLRRLKELLDQIR